MFHFLFLMIIHINFSAKIVNIDTVFLYSDIEEEIYMECPHGMMNVY